MNLFGMGFLELVFILVVALLVLGPNKMVEVARTLGRYIRELQRASSELPRAFSLDEEQSVVPPPQRQSLPDRPFDEHQDANSNE